MFRTLLAITLPALVLVAQRGPGPAGPRGGPGPAGPRGGPGNFTERAEIMTRLNAIRTERLQSALGVSPALAKSVADRWGQFDQESHDRRQGIRAARQKIQDVLMGPGSDPEKNVLIAPLIGQCTTLQKQQRDAKEKFEADLQRTLTPVQQGRLLLLMDEFQRRLNEILPERR